MKKLVYIAMFYSLMLFGFNTFAETLTCKGSLSWSTIERATENYSDLGSTNTAILIMTKIDDGMNAFKVTSLKNKIDIVGVKYKGDEYVDLRFDANKFYGVVQKIENENEDGVLIVGWSRDKSGGSINSYVVHGSFKCDKSELESFGDI